MGAMGRIEDSTAEISTEGVTRGDHMRYTVFIDAMPADYIVKGLLARRNMVSSDDGVRVDSHHCAMRVSTGRRDLPLVFVPVLVGCTYVYE